MDSILHELSAGTLDQDPDQQWLGATHEGNPAPDQSGRKFSRWKISVDAGGCPSPPYYNNHLGNETIFEYGVAPGESGRYRSRSYLKPTRSPSTNVRKNLDTTNGFPVSRFGGDGRFRVNGSNTFSSQFHDLVRFIPSPTPARINEPGFKLWTVQHPALEPSGEARCIA